MIATVMASWLKSGLRTARHPTSLQVNAPLSSPVVVFVALKPRHLLRSKNREVTLRRVFYANL